MLDQRAKTLLKALVERYIAEGQPVGSRTLSRASGLDLSPATIRNVMSDLEELGLIASPHTSAGRIPTARGYRLFVDTMLTARPVDLDQASPDLAAARGQLHPDQPQRVIAQAAHLLSSLSSFVGVVTAPRKASVFHHIEFLRLGERRVLVILVAPDGDAPEVAQPVSKRSDLLVEDNEHVEVGKQLVKGVIDPTLQYIKREGMRLLWAGYPDDATADAEIEKLSGFYALNYPDVVATKAAQIDNAVEQVKALHRVTTTPPMKNTT